ncbi:unnamed protein product [Adineta steineri]|uniref:Uncharacterized protein n=1 Tax=Adineta steineri TaxID=433720 RepID=A0A819E889_9BILA|nr:unnamed protein product [Adineta steineri]
MTNKKIDQLTIENNLDQTTTNSDLTVNIKSKNKIYVKSHELNSSPGKILLPSTIGIPPRNGSPENRLRDPRILWAPAISISGKNDQPLITPQYQKKEQRIAEKSQQVKLNSKIATNADLSYLTRLGNDKTKLPISFLPHKINPSKRPLSITQRGPGPASYQQYKDYNQIGEEYIYMRQPRVRINPLIGPKLKRERHPIENNDENLIEKKKIPQNMKSFWSTIGTRTYDSRLPNAPVSTIHHRFNTTFDVEETKKKTPGMALPGPAMYPLINTKGELIGKDTCTARGVSIAPRYHEKRMVSLGPGPAMIERDLLDKGYKNILKKSPAFSMSSRWSPYSHTYTDECSDTIF